MKVVSIMNYPDRIQENIMCAIWMKKVRENFPKNFEIDVFYKDSISSFLIEQADILKINLIQKKHSNEIDFSRHADFVKANHNVNFKLYNLCNINEPFIFIDADAFILTNSDPLLEASQDKEFIAINHQNIPGQTDMLKESVLNSGVMIVSNYEIFNWNMFKKILYRDQRFVYPGTDQSLINSLVKEQKINYNHYNIGFEWNSWAKYTVWEKSKPFCKGLEIEHPVFINHYWNNAKPWNINCPVYESYYNNEYDYLRK